MADNDHTTPDPKHCGSKLSKGKPGTCRRPAGWGTSHVGTGKCKLHGGSTGTHKKAASVAIARKEVADHHLSTDVGPAEALLGELARTHGWIQYLESKVGELRETELVWGKTRHKVGGEDYGSTSEAKPSIWYALLRDERKHLVAVIDSCTRANVAEHQMRLAEDQGRMVAGVIQRSFAAQLDAVLHALTETLGDGHEAITVVMSVWATSARDVVRRELQTILAASGDALGVMAS